MPAIDALQDLKNSLIRKTLNGSVFIADHSVASIDDATLFDVATGDLAAAGLPAASWSDLGYLTDAGAQFAQQLTESNVTSWQSATPSRSDVTAKITTLQVACQETKLATISNYVGIDPATIKTTAANGVVRIDEAAAPKSRFVRALSIAVDEQPGGEFVICRYLPNAKVTSLDNQAFDKSDNPTLWGTTLTGYVDDALGFAHSWIFGGAGWKAALVDMGFTLGP